MISSLMFIWLRFTLPQFASYLSSFQTDPSKKLGGVCVIMDRVREGEIG